MRFLFEEDRRFYRYKNTDFLEENLKSILKDIDFSSTTRYMKNTVNFFNNDRPNIYWWSAIQLANYDWICHIDCYYSKIEDIKSFWTCYQPHLIMGNNIDRLITTIPMSYFKNLTHLVLKSPNDDNIIFAKTLNIKLWSISFTFTDRKWSYKLEQICGKN